jgi:hypothetical protein
VNRIRITLCAALLAALPLASRAAPFKVYSPTVQQGVAEVEYRGYVDSDHRSELNKSQEQNFSVGYGLTDYWFTEVYTVYGKDGSAPLKNQSIEWENRFQLTPQGKYPVDYGLLAEFEFATRSGDPNEFSIAPIFESELSRHLLATANLFFERQFGGTEREPGTTFAYAGRLRYHLNRYFDPALELFGEPGEIGRFGAWDRQDHWMGPAFYGEARLGHGALEYSAALLFGTSQAASDRRAVVRLEYEF